MQFFASAVVIIIAGTLLTRCADAIAEMTGLGRLLVGSILLAGATSLPELAVDISAARAGAPNLGMGDLVGSSLFNLLILAIADLSHRKRGRLLSRLSAAHALSGAVSIGLTATVGLFILVDAKVQPGGLFGTSWGSLAVLAGYLLGIRIVYHDQKLSMAEAEKEVGARPAHSDFESEDDGGDKPRVFSLIQSSLPAAIAGYVLAAGVILAAAPFLAESADQIARLSGLGRTFIGTTLVALSTSLPELVATIAAIRIGAVDLAIGNVFGSNAFNMLIVLAMDLAYPGPIFAVFEPTHALTAFGVIVVSSVAILGQLYRVEKRILFIEPDAGLVIALAIGTLWLVYLAR
jgi:cation:H+ antiporter